MRDWRCGPPPLSFCTAWRPALRTRRCPSGLETNDHLTATHNKLGIRLGFLLCIVASTGCFYSVEQPGSSLLLKLACFTRLLQLGGQLAKFCYCSFGCTCGKSTIWLRNKPWMLDLPRGCSCSSPAEHFPIHDRFDESRLEAFERCCSPSCSFVFGRTPALGEEVRTFLLGYPAAFTRQLAAGSLAAKAGRCKPFPLSARWGAAEVLRGVSEACMSSEFASFETRTPHDDPGWIGELADSLPFKEVLRYRFRKSGHINILEARMFKTFQKYLARRAPDCRSLSLLDSRATMGAVAKGRSSSPALIRVLQGTLPYTLGGGLYNGTLHVYSGQNRSDGPSRGKPVDPPTKEVPLWLTELCQGQTHRFDLTVASSAVAETCSALVAAFAPARWRHRGKSRPCKTTAPGSSRPPQLAFRVHPMHS